MRPIPAHEPRALRRAIGRIALLCTAAAPMSGCCAWPFEHASEGYSTSRVVAMPFRVAHAGYRRDAALPAAVCKSVCGREACFPSSVVGPSGVESAVVVCNDYSPRSCSDAGFFRMPSGRRSAALGAYVGPAFAALAEAEAASVDDFDELAQELEALGAPAALVAAARRARADESRHADTMRGLAGAHGATTAATRARAPRTARGATPRRRPSLRRLAIENAVLGCVGETWGALLLTLGARRAAGPDVRRQLRRVASDEARHAALAFAIHAWLAPQLSTVERVEVGAALDRAARELLEERPRASAAVARALGHPTEAEHAVIAPRLVALVRAGMSVATGDGSAPS